jgi:hypothetical protein
LNGTVDADVTLNNNTVLITSSQNYFAENINLNGANTFSIQDGVQGWYDWQLFKFGVGATLGFKLGEDSFFALDGFVGPPPMRRASLLRPNSARIPDSASATGSMSRTGTAHSKSPLTRTSSVHALCAQPGFRKPERGCRSGNLRLHPDGQSGQPGRDQRRCGDQRRYLRVRLRRDPYRGGDDTVFVGEATINGRIETDDGDDTVLLDGTTINTAINQGVPAVELAKATT